MTLTLVLFYFSSFVLFFAFAFLGFTFLTWERGEEGKRNATKVSVANLASFVGFTGETEGGIQAPKTNSMIPYRLIFMNFHQPALDIIVAANRQLGSKCLFSLQTLYHTPNKSVLALLKTCPSWLQASPFHSAFVCLCFVSFRSL